MAVAVERGTPLADVLRAQAVDVREAGAAQLLEAGGRKEIAMIVPVVFLVLPVTVVFALFPGFIRVELRPLEDVLGGAMPTMIDRTVTVP